MSDLSLIIVYVECLHLKIVVSLSVNECG